MYSLTFKYFVSSTPTCFSAAGSATRASSCSLGILPKASLVGAKTVKGPGWDRASVNPAAPAWANRMENLKQEISLVGVKRGQERQPKESETRNLIGWRIQTSAIHLPLFLLFFLSLTLGVIIPFVLNGQCPSWMCFFLPLFPSYNLDPYLGFELRQSPILAEGMVSMGVFSSSISLSFSLPIWTLLGVWDEVVPNLGGGCGEHGCL